MNPDVTLFVSQRGENLEVRFRIAHEGQLFEGRDEIPPGGRWYDYSYEVLRAFVGKRLVISGTLDE
jgi:hypothetical protein